MPRLHSLFLSIGLVALLAGCQFQGPGRGQTPDGVTPNAVAGDAIEVTALDGAPPAAEGKDALPPGGDATAQPQSAPPDPSAEPEPAAPEPAPIPDLGEAEAVDPEAVAEPEPEPAKSDRQIACEKKKGRWVSAAGDSHTCVFLTKDAGKSCTRASDCDGECLARSGTCSPLKPLLGCNEILQDNGVRVTLCVE